MLRAILKKSLRQHPTKQCLYGHLPPITKTIQIRRTRHVVNCWRSRDELISDVLLWTPSYGQAKPGRPVRTYIQQLCEDTGYSPENLPEEMNNRERWRERVRNIRAGDATRWWWMYDERAISFQTLFVQAFTIVVDSWTFNVLLLYSFWDDWPIFMISSSNEQQLEQLEYTLLKPDCHSWWISKMQSDNLEERYAIKFCFKLGKKATKTYGMLQTAFGASCINQASVFEWHKRFKEGRESVRDDDRYGRRRESIQQSWLAKG